MAGGRAGVHPGDDVNFVAKKLLFLFRHISSPVSIR